MSGPGPRSHDLVPFSAVAIAGVVGAAIPDLPAEWSDWLAACALTLVALAAARSEALRRRGELAAVLPALVYLASVGFLRDSVGGSKGGLGILVLLPVIYVALHGTPRQLAITIAGAAATWAVPLALVGGERYPASGWRATVLLVLLSAVLGHAVQRLVMRIREEARERTELARRLEQIAGTDHLTALPNRRAWTVRLVEAIDEAQNRDESLSVALFDLDGLKRVNDSRGHAAGDELLRAMAAAWSRELGPRDVLARLGGDEFALALPGRSAPAAVETVERFLRETRGLGGASAGVAQHAPGEHRSVLLARADAALYAAKGQGGDVAVAAPAPVLV